MRVPTAKIEEKATIVKRCVQAEWERDRKRRGVFTEERTKKFHYRIWSTLYSEIIKTKIGNIRKLGSVRSHTKSVPHAPCARMASRRIRGGMGDVMIPSAIHRADKTPSATNDEY